MLPSLSRVAKALVGSRNKPSVRVSSTDARRYVELERAAEAPPQDGCEWLDDTTIEDLELADVARHLDRTVSAVGAQHWWRWLVGPAQRTAVLDRREQLIAAMDAPTRESLRRELQPIDESDVAYIPLLLWSNPTRFPAKVLLLRVLAFAIVASSIIAIVYPAMIFAIALLFLVNTKLDDFIDARLSRQVRAFEMFGSLLRVATRINKQPWVPSTMRTEIAAELAALAPVRRRVAWLTPRDKVDPLDFYGLFRAALLIRAIAFSRCIDEMPLYRDHMRTLHRLVGELDAAQAVATLRAERADVCVPQLHEGRADLHVLDLRHPAIVGAIGNDLDAGAGSMIITGSNMSGKSTFLRTIAVNAVLAQSIHTVFGQWRASTFRIAAAMRAIDTTGEGISTYAAEVASIGRLVKAAAAVDEMPALFVVDEPFRGTNPAVRVPIVVAVLEYLAANHSLFAATHDLEVANRLSTKFARGYFRELDDPDSDGADFDFQLRSGTARTTNAVTLLKRAGYPQQILDAVAAETAAIANVA